MRACILILLGITGISFFQILLRMYVHDGRRCFTRGLLELYVFSPQKKTFFLEGEVFFVMDSFPSLVSTPHPPIYPLTSFFYHFLV